MDKEGAFLPTLGPKVRFNLLFLVTTSWAKLTLDNGVEENCHCLLAYAWLKSKSNAKSHFNDELLKLKDHQRDISFLGLPLAKIKKSKGLREMV